MSERAGAGGAARHRDDRDACTNANGRVRPASPRCALKPGFARAVGYRARPSNTAESARGRSGGPIGRERAPGRVRATAR